jgi:hypothetical protein
MDTFAGFTLPRLRGINAEKRLTLPQRLSMFKRNSGQYGRPTMSACGPYECRQFATHDGLSFYLNDSATMPELRYTLGESWSYDDCDPMTAIVMRLPRGRGFLAGWTMGAGMISEVSRYVWDDEHAAMTEAERMTQRAAEDEAAYQADERAKMEDEENDPAGYYLAYLDKRAQDEPHNAAFIGRIAGNVRKLETLS